MYLKKLQMTGFKSFADKTVLDFNGGITAVIGPNGTGKSNISDAIRWVLGEQRMKTLRGGKLEDVIFNGTQHRKALGYAEVILTLDNSDSALPIEYTEVSVSRRVYRSGESEYAINGAPCRLKDIYQLFLDTGVGRDGYSIIGQGKIDDIISSKAEDRRVVLEEASGIMKYKVKKLEAERKLDHTKQNIERIDDILLELGEQRTVLESQSEVAREFLNMQSELTEIDISLMVHNLSNFDKRIKDYDVQIKNQNDTITQYEAGLVQITEMNRTNTQKSQQLEELISQKNVELRKQETLYSENNSDVVLRQERKENLNENIQRLVTENEKLNEDKALVHDEIKANNTQIEELNNLINNHDSLLNKSLGDYKSVLDELAEFDSIIDEKNKALLKLQDQLAENKLLLGNVNIRRQSIEKRCSDIDTELAEIQQESNKSRELIDELKRQVEFYHTKKADSDKELAEYESLREENEKKYVALKNEYELSKGKLHLKSERKSMLVNMENSFEGYNNSVRNILEKCRKDSSFAKGIYGAVAQNVSIDKEYRIAIETVLGGSLQNIITQSEDDAKKAIDFLKKERLGRATFLPVDVVRERRLEDDLLDKIIPEEGYIAIASDLVDCEEKFEQIVKNLLGNTVVVDTFNNAVKISKKIRNKVRLVTLTGEILNKGGAISGGHIEGKGFGLVSRSDDIRILTKEINDLNKKVESLEDDLDDIDSSNYETEQKIKLIKDGRQNVELEILRDEAHISQLDGALVKNDAKSQMLQAEKDQLLSDINNEAQNETDVENSVLKIEKEIAEIRHSIGASQDEYREKNQAREEQNAIVTEFKLKLTQCKEEINSINRVIKMAEDKIKDIDETIESNNKQIFAYKNEVDEIVASIKKVEQENASEFETLEKIKSELENLYIQKKEVDEENSGTLEKLQEINKSVLLVQEDVNKIEIRKAKTETELVNIKNRLWDDYELTISAAEEKSSEVKNVAETQKRINQLRNSIRELGPINVASIEDFKKTSERYEFMSEQKNDLVDSIHNLEKIISDMTRIMKKQFTEKFALINKNFNEVFRDLFGGGKAELIVEDQNDILESGIDIIVQPPGKKLQNMMALSGGECALSAIALLFAILKLRPSPFCLLDEIEAALDEANVDRLANYMSNYSDDSQFIVITHKKGMMNSSDTMYGVTMQEHGVSTIVSLKIDG